MNKANTINKKQFFNLLSGFILCLCISSCGETDDLDQIKNKINRLQTAVEEEKPEDFIDILDKGFLGNEHLTKVLIKKYLILNLMRHSNIEVRISHTDIVINKSDPSLASVNIKVLLTGGKGLVPEQGRLMEIKSQWVKYNNEWMVKIARWDR